MSSQRNVMQQLAEPRRKYDVGMEFCGWFRPGGYDAVVTRGDVEARTFHAFWLADDRVVAGMHVNL
jgi:3-phenylpropionate/trans-cinnamate dioxygenase ferredoxin reductase subunit